MSSSDEDLPLVQRAKRTTNVIDLDSDDEPSWLANAKSPAALDGLPSATESSDVEEVEGQTQEATQPAAAPARQYAAAVGEQREPPVTQEPASQQGLEQQPTGQRAAQQPRQQQKKAVLPHSRLKGSLAAAKFGTEESAAIAAVAPEPAGPDALQPNESQQPASQQPATAQKRASGLHHVPANEMPLMLPEKLPQNKVLIELESIEGGATDLAGDAGAVGRILVRGPAGDQQVQIDLKGILYDATIAPCPVTMAMVNVGQTEAKVESLFTEFLQLREDTRFSCHDSAALDTLLAEDQEDNYMVGEGAPGGANAAGEKKEGAAGKKGAARKGGAGAGEGKGGGRGKGGSKAGGAAKRAGKGLKKTAGGGVKKAAGGGGVGKGRGGGKAGASKPKAAKAKPKAAAGAAKPKSGASKGK
ncbi:hypothetical protein N2152v2_001507 [Parachlorella kessleri]